MSIQFEYFYGNEAEQFTFYRIPKILVTSPTFKRVSDSAKLLYGLMLDRMSLSIPMKSLGNRAAVMGCSFYKGNIRL